MLKRKKSQSQTTLPGASGKGLKLNVNCIESMTPQGGHCGVVFKEKLLKPSRRVMIFPPSPTFPIASWWFSCLYHIKKCVYLEPWSTDFFFQKNSYWCSINIQRAIAVFQMRDGSGLRCGSNKGDGEKGVDEGGRCLETGMTGPPDWCVSIHVLMCCLYIIKYIYIYFIFFLLLNGKNSLYILDIHLFSPHPWPVFSFS